MDKDICAKVTSMLGSYIENKLQEADRKFVEYHFAKCSSCRKKYYEMSRIIGDLHYEYEKMINEFDRIEAGKNEESQEYQYIYSSLSPYADNELNYEDSLKFRKYLLKSKTARDELEKIYELKKNIRNSAAEFAARSGLNFSKKVIKRLKQGNKKIKLNIYEGIFFAAGFLLAVLAAIIILFGFNYYGAQPANALHMHSQPDAELNFPQDASFSKYDF